MQELGLLADEPIISKPKKVDNKSENHSQDWEPPEPARKSERERKQVGVQRLWSTS